MRIIRCPDYKLEDPKYVLDVLKEYHEQTAEDCRTIGTQKNKLLSLIVAQIGLIYALIQVLSSTEISGNESNITSLSNNISNFPLPTVIMPSIILIIIFLFVFIYFMALSSFLFFTMQLPLMDMFIVKIEELQRDILFKKMGYVDLFSWNEIETNNSKTFKDYLNQKLIRDNITSFENLEYVNTSLNDRQIKIDITKKIILFEKKKSGTLNLDEKKMIAFLTIDGIELDQFNVRKENSNFILYESEMKYKFRNLMPHFNVLKASFKTNIYCIAITFLSLVLIWLSIYVYQVTH